MGSVQIGALVLLLLCLSVLPGAAAGDASAPAVPAPASAESPEAVVGRIRSHIGTLLAAPQLALYARHLQSVLALCEEQVLRLRFAGAHQEEQTKEAREYLLAIEAGLNDDCDRADSYLVDGRRELVLARLSRSDDTLQFCTVSLPAHWDPDKAYPLHVMLHGAGPRMGLAYVNFTFLPHGSGPAKPRPEVIIVCPWMRGNRVWREDGESENDIWEALADVKSFAKLDPDRWYISGHSMGADDTWGLVQRTPDLWAAVGLQSVATYAAPPELGLIPNLSHVPFYTWVGDQDTVPGRIESSKGIGDLLSAVGGTSKFVLEPGVGHNPRGEDTAAMREWLLQHARQRPDHFTFVMDTARHRGVWGITVPRARRFAPSLPAPHVTFECWIEGATVRIQVTGTKQLEVDLGPQGLGMSGTVKLIVNGKPRFEGAVPGEAVGVDLGEEGR